MKLVQWLLRSSIDEKMLPTNGRTDRQADQRADSCIPPKYIFGGIKTTSFTRKTADTLKQTSFIALEHVYFKPKNPSFPSFHK